MGEIDHELFEAQEEEEDDIDLRRQVEALGRKRNRKVEGDEEGNDSNREKELEREIADHVASNADHHTA